MSQKNWTPEQRQLFLKKEDGTFLHPRVAVSADAGSGKTSVLVERIKQIAPHEKILCISFTEKSKADLQDRLLSFPNVEISTIHGFCLKLLRDYGSTLGLPFHLKILSEEEAQSLLFEAAQKMHRLFPPENSQHGFEALLMLLQAVVQQAGCDAIHELGSESAENVHQKVHTTSIAQWIEKARQEYQQSKMRHQSIDYVDIEVYTDELLHKRPILEKIVQNYAHLFVDEFQDTNVLQGRLIERLISLSPKYPTLFVVGDAKQSIYGFRGANVRVFLDFFAKVPEEKKLSTNFRTEASLLADFNQVSRHLFKAYQPMQAGSNAKGTDKILWRIKSDHQAKSILSALERFKEKNIPLSQVALLLRRIKGNENVLEELRKAGVRVAAQATQSAQENEAFTALATLWVWAYEPWQKYEALSVFQNFQKELKLENPHQDFELNLHLAQRWQKKLFLNDGYLLLRQLQQEFSLLQRFGLNWIQFEAFMLNAFKKGQSGALIGEKLRKEFLTGQCNYRLSVLPPPEDLQECLKVYTIHSSKGLEFPYVILADLGKTRARSNPFYWKGREVVVLGRDEDGDLDKSHPLAEEAIAKTQEKEQEESARLLYVALTRAQKGLVTIEQNMKNSEKTWQSWIEQGLKDYQVHSLDTQKEVTWVSHSLNKKDFPHPSVAISDIKPIPRLSIKKELPKIFPSEDITITKLLEQERWDALDASAWFKQWLQDELGKKVFDSKLHSEKAWEFEFLENDQWWFGKIPHLVFEEQETWIIFYQTTREECLPNLGSLPIYVNLVKKMTPSKKVKAFTLNIFSTSMENIWKNVW